MFFSLEVLLFSVDFFFGDVPLILKPIESESEASKFVRESKDVVLQQILKDFTDACYPVGRAVC